MRVMAADARIVSTDEADIRLDRWFRRHFPGLTQGTIQKLCRTGQVRVNGHRAEAAMRLAPGQSVRIPPLPASPTPKPAPDVDPNTARDLQRLVIYRDDNVLVVNKPHGMPVQGGPGITRHLDGLLDVLRFGAPDRPRLVHRLDREHVRRLVARPHPRHRSKAGGGIPRTRRGKDLLGRAGRPPGPPRRSYRPGPPPHRWTPRRTHRGRRSQRRGCRRAITDYRTLDHAGQKLAWLELRPLTGRTSASRALRRARSANPGGREIRAPGPEQCVQCHCRGALR